MAVKSEHSSIVHSPGCSRAARIKVKVHVPPPPREAGCWCQVCGPKKEG